MPPCNWCFNVTNIYTSRVYLEILPDINASHAILGEPDHVFHPKLPTLVYAAIGVLPHISDPEARHLTKLDDAYDQPDHVGQQRGSSY